MEIPKIKFKTISKESTYERSSGAPFVTLYHNCLYLPKCIATMIKGKYSFATISVAGSYLAIEFSHTEKRNYFEIIFNGNEERGILWARIGATSLARQIAKELDLPVDKHRYFKSVDYKIQDNIMYFEFNRSECMYSRRSK